MLLTLSGQPNTENGKSAEENQVSKTSSSKYQPNTRVEVKVVIGYTLLYNN